MSRYLVYIAHSFNGIGASNTDGISLIFSHKGHWGSHWTARTPTERWRPTTSLYGTDINIVWTGSEEANNYFYMMDRMGSEVNGQA